MPEFFGEQEGELDVLLAQCLVAHLDAARLKQFLDVTLAQREAMVKPKCLLNDAQGKTVAVRLAVSHGYSA